MWTCKRISTLSSRGRRTTACFGDTAAVADGLAAAAAEGVDALEAAEDAEAKTVEARFLPGPLKPPNLKQTTTAPPDTFRSGAGAARACVHAALAKNIAGRKTDTISAYSHSITSTWAMWATL